MLRSQLARFPLTTIVIAQFFGTSLWFSVNGVGQALQQAVGLSTGDLGLLTIAVQAGFITGTLAIATTGLADRVRANRLFAGSAVAGAVVNVAFILAADHLAIGALLRFLTGLCLAGIYPLGMKLVVSWTPRQAGAALGWLVGMLTLGTASPHLLRGLTLALPWQWPLVLASLLSLIAAALGYFGHSWELYAFWALVPLLVARELARIDISLSSVAWLSFVVMAVGTPGCVLAGKASRHYGSAAVARTALATSGALCLFYPLLGSAPPLLLIALLLVWGVSVIADSAQFSALASSHAPPARLGAALAGMNAIGFALTIPAIALVTTLWADNGLAVLWWLLPGPALGLIAMRQTDGVDKA